MSKVISKVRAFLMGGFWTGLVTGIGLSPLWLKCLICKLAGKPYCWTDVLQEGVIMFFALTLVGTIGVDLQLIEKNKISQCRLVNVLFHVLVPFCIFPGVAAAFGVLVTVPQNTNMIVLGNIQIAAFALAIVYALLVKVIQFSKEII